MGAVTQDTTHDYTAVMAYCRDTRNWFKRARGEWPEPSPLGVDEVEVDPPQDGERDEAKHQRDDGVSPVILSTTHDRQSSPDD